MRVHMSNSVLIIFGYHALILQVGGVDPSSAF